MDDTRKINRKLQLLVIRTQEIIAKEFYYKNILMNFKYDSFYAERGF